MSTCFEKKIEGGIKVTANEHGIEVTNDGENLFVFISTPEARDLAGALVEASTWMNENFPEEIEVVAETETP